MKYLILAITFLATPAMAHHEVVIAASMAPMMGGLVVIAACVTTLLRDRLGLKLWRSDRGTLSGKDASASVHK